MNGKTELDTKIETPKEDYKIDNKMLEGVLNYMIEQTDYYKRVVQDQRQALEMLFSEHEELVDKYEDLFETMMIEDDTAHLRKEILKLKDSLKLVESLIDFTDNKNENKK